MSERREWWIVQYKGDTFVLESMDDLPPDGDDSSLIHVREVLPGDTFPKQSYEKYESLQNSFGLLKERHEKLVEAAREVIALECDRVNGYRNGEIYDPIANPGQFDKEIVELAKSLESEVSDE